MRRNTFYTLGYLVLLTLGMGFSQAEEATQVQPSRLLRFQGMLNFRDLGGYETSEGNTVKWGSIYRSDALGKMTEQDLEKFTQLGVKSVCDFRSPDELHQQPDPDIVTKSDEIQYLNLDIMGLVAEKSGSKTNWIDLMKSGEMSPDDMMEKGYVANATLGAAGYRAMFEQLLANEEGATLYHCTAGKDRTGVASALILMALGVPNETIVEDYMLSLKYWQMPESMMEQASKMYGIPVEVMREFNVVKPEWIQAVFDLIEKRYGGFEGYFSEVLGFDPADLEKLKSRYLE